MKRPTKVLPHEKHLTELLPPCEPRQVAQSASSIKITLGTKRYRINILTSAEELSPVPAPVIPIREAARNKKRPQR